MNFKFFAGAFVFLFSLSLLAYSFSFLGVEGTLVDSFGKLLALCFGLSLLFAFSYPFFRGVRKGDVLNASVSSGFKGPFSFVFSSSSSAVALESGRVGDEIEVSLSDGSSARAVVTSYGGTFSLPSVRVLRGEKRKVFDV